MQIHHTAIVCGSQNVLKEFYNSMFGLTAADPWERGGGLCGMSLVDEKGSRIELIESTRIADAPKEDRDIHTKGVNHVAFLVDNMEEAVERAQSLGGSVHWPIQQGKTVKQIAFVRDPEGNLIELLNV